MADLEDTIVKCPYCGHEQTYNESVYDYLTQDYEYNSIFETETMMCRSCEKKFHATAEYELVGVIVEPIEESE